MFNHNFAYIWFARVTKRCRVNAIKRQGSRSGEKSTGLEGIPFREDAARWWNAMRGDVRGVRRPISARPVSGAENCAHVTADSISTPWAPARCTGVVGSTRRGRVEAERQGNATRKLKKRKRRQNETKPRWSSSGKSLKFLNELVKWHRGPKNEWLRLVWMFLFSHHSQFEPFSFLFPSSLPFSLFISPPTRPSASPPQARMLPVPLESPLIMS